MADIAELGYKVDSSGLVEGTKALDDNAAAAEKTGNAAARLEKEYQSMSRTVDQSSKALGDRLGGALDRIGVGTGSVIAELQTLNRTQSEVLAALGGLDTRLTGTASALKAYESAGQQAAAAVTSTATASQRLETDLAAQEARYRSVAREAVSYAESMRGANLSDRALAEAIREATSAYDSRAAVAARMGTEQERLAARAKSLQEAEARATNQARDAARATQAQELNLKKLLGQIDPTVAGLNRLADMEDRLAKARDLGLIKPQVFQQYQAQLEATRAKTLGAAQGTGSLTGQLGRLNLQSVETQTSLAVLMRALATGNFSQAQASVTSLTARTGAMSAMFSATGLAVAGFAVALGSVVALQYSSAKEMDRLNGALLATGGAAGMTAAQLRSVATGIGSATGRFTEANKAVLALAGIGRLTGDALAQAAAGAVSLAQLTGSTIDSAANEMEQVAKAPAKGLLELNDKYQFLTASVYEHVVALEQQGKETEAVAVATAAASEEFQRRAEEMKARTSELTGYVGRLREEWQLFTNDLKSLVNPTLDLDIAATQQKLSALQAGTFTAPRYLLPGQRDNDIAVLQKTLQLLSQQKRDEEELAAGTAFANDLRQQGLDAYVQIDGVLEKAKTSTEKLEESTRKLKASYEALRISDPGSSLLKGVKFGGGGGISGGSYDTALAQLVKDSQKGVKKPKQNADDNSAQTFIANVERQITANQQLAESGDKVTASDRMVIQARQMLADKTNNMTAATRTLLQAMIPQLEASDAQAQAEVQRQRGMQASLALTERLTQLEKQRQEQADIDLMGIGRGGDATQMLQRQLDIQRQFLREQEKLDKAYNSDRLSLTAEAAVIRKAQYDQDTASLQTSLNNSLDIERNYQERRAAMLGDWRTGVNRVWADYVSAAGNASDQAGSLVSNSLSGMEDALVRLAQTGKLSFTSLANSIIADLARIAAKQAAVGLFNALAGAWGGGSTYTGSGTGAGSIGGFGNNQMNFGGGRANGGPVRGSTLYEVGEGGKPELFNDGRGRTYLIPGNNGNVVPTAPMSKGNAGAPAPTPQFNITINGASGGGAATAKPNQSGGADIEVMLDQMEGRIAGNFAQGVSPLNSALEGRYDVAARV